MLKGEMTMRELYWVVKTGSACVFGLAGHTKEVYFNILGMKYLNQGCTVNRNRIAISMVDSVFSQMSKQWTQLGIFPTLN